MKPKKKAKTTAAKGQVAALPLCLDPEGRLRVLILTSRETGRFIVPKGWVEKGKRNRCVAASEAAQEAGVVGEISKKPIGRYRYWKRLGDHYQLCDVKVFALKAERQMSVWREKGQRRMAWFLIDDAITLVDDPGMVALLRKLPKKKLKAQPLKLDQPVARHSQRL